MRIALDTQSTFGQKTGIGQYTRQLVKALRETAPQHEFCELNLGMDVVMRTDRRIRWQQVSLPQQARRAGADLLHVTGFDAPWRKPCPVVLTVHDLIGRLFPHHLPPAARFYWAAWLPFTIRRADHVIAVSEHTRRDLVRLTNISPEKITVIPHGVDARFTPCRDMDKPEAVRIRYHLPPRFLLYLSTLEPRKGLEPLIAAYAQIASRTDHALVLAGKPGWGMDGLHREIARLGLEERVHFPGYVDDADRPALYGLADLFVYPSRYEGFGLPVLEAMACGTPVVCSNNSSLPEVTGGAAVLLPPDQPGMLAEAILELTACPQRREDLRRRGLQRAAKFSWQEAARRTLQVYQELR